MSTSKVIARTYVVANAHEAHELIELENGMFIVAVNGQIPDARQKMTKAEARQWYDSAGYQIGDRP